MAPDYDVEFIDRGDRNREARFLVRDVSPAFANGIRRAMIADVPTLSIDEVRVIENSSVMFDEQIALRLGLVPLTTPDDYEIGETVTLALDVEGPGTAYSGDLVSTDDRVEPADKNVPIIDLKDPEGSETPQRLEVEADAVYDVGREHAKHQGGVAVGYRHLQTVEVVGDADEFGDDDPHILRGVIEESEASHASATSSGDEPRDGELIPTEEFDHDLTQRYPGKEVEVNDVPNAFVFHVETDGSMSVDDLVTAAVDTIHDRADELKDAVQL
ncbi:DNA-directed RNA polymerase subunit D [Halorientalis sp. IM1011]|uniref:DNA-directed RNA polymerase subunit D n=1 Tax=Halorientalis sp. IM1011 TaxID=1932360 RepID=UPI00097CD596|nr:DNA-directed RNA polymerase subunit D [Halorientalis sp. IM1011]AQL41399.1 DNA-directed RNA polymerase subunit D [Halorientalis sp. IM1011]